MHAREQQGSGPIKRHTYSAIWTRVYFRICVLACSPARKCQFVWQCSSCRSLYMSQYLLRLPPGILMFMVAALTNLCSKILPSSFLHDSVGAA